MISLTRGFMYAGAASVMASLWKVDDAATAELMKHFYRAMLKGGLPPAAALREAQVAMWQQKQWRSPYYWAAFVLQGEYKGRREGIHFNAQAVLTITLVVGAILMLLLSSLYAAKLRKNTVNATRAQRRQ